MIVRKGGGMAGPAATQAQNLGNELVHPSIHGIYELLDQV